MIDDEKIQEINEDVEPFTPIKEGCGGGTMKPTKMFGKLSGREIGTDLMTEMKTKV